MKKIAIWAIILTMLVGCSRNDESINPNTNPSNKQTEFFASVPSTDDSRTYVEDNKYLRWNAGDEITIFNGNSYNSHWQFVGTEGANSGKFTEVEESGFVTGTALDLTANYAVYPYDEDITITENGVISLTLPAIQPYNHSYTNSFGRGANTMMAVTKNTSDNFLAFRNLCGYLKLKLYGDNITVKNITVKGNNGEKIAGNATVSMVYGSAPTVTMGANATETITIDCGEGVTLSNDSENPTIFWVAIPEITFEDGITIEVIDTNEQVFSKQTLKEVPIETNLIQPMATLETVFNSPETEGPANNEIWYTTIDGNIIEPFTDTPIRCGEFDYVTYKTNSYNDAGYGVMSFQSDISQINMQAFFNNANLQTIILPESIERINRAAFQGCSNLEEIHIGTSMKQIDQNAFLYCTQLKKVNISNLSTWCSIHFYDYSAQPLYYARNLYLNNVLIEDLIIPNDVTSISQMCFYSCESIKNLSISNNVNIINAIAFGCCSNITKLYIPSSVETLDTYAFKDCSGLIEIEIDNGVKTIGLGVFMDCENLSTILCKCITPPTGNTWMFDSNASDRKIYVPTESIETYKAAPYWKRYADDIMGYDF